MENTLQSWSGSFFGGPGKKGEEIYHLLFGQNRDIKLKRKKKKKKKRCFCKKVQEAVSGDETRPQPQGGEEEKETHTAQSCFYASVPRPGPQEATGRPLEPGPGSLPGTRPLGRAALTPLISMATSACELQLHCFLAKMTD